MREYFTSDWVFTGPFPKSNKRTRFESFGLLPLTCSAAVITKLCKKEPEVHDFSKIGQCHRARRRILVSEDLDNVTRRHQIVSLRFPKLVETRICCETVVSFSKTIKACSERSPKR
jgi:hypothetical protein